MNASRAFTHVLSGRDVKNGVTFTYHGKGYTYHLHKTATDIWAKLQIARKNMQAFLKAIGLGEESKRTIYSLDGLSVCDQGVGGWFEVFVIDERKLFAVINFIKKLNRFMLGALHPVPVVHKHHYFIEARKFEHKPPREQRSPHPMQHHNSSPKLESVRQGPIQFQSIKPVGRQPLPVAQSSRIQMLAQTINNRFGH